MCWEQRGKVGRGLGVGFPWEPRPSSQSLPSPAQPRFSLSPNFRMSRTSRRMAFLKIFAPSCLSVLGFGWALPEGVKGSSPIQGLGGDSGAFLRPGGEREGSQSGERILPPLGLQRPSWAPSPAVAGPLEESRCEVVGGVHEKHLGNSYLTTEPKSTSLCPFTPFFIQSTNMLSFGRKTNLTPIRRRARNTGGLYRRKTGTQTRSIAQKN